MRLYRFLIVLTISLSVFIPISAHAGAAKTLQGKDGATMVLIPSGTFQMGSDDEDLVVTAPVHAVHVSDFYMDEHPVTNKQYADFLNAVKPKEGLDGNRVTWVVLRSDLDEKRKHWWPTEMTYEKGLYVAYKGYKDNPVITVSWNGAMAYCAWADKRLPYEAEWERAARGGLIGRSFPWGDEIPTREIMHSRLWTSNKTAPPIDKAKSGKPNAYGLYNMAGGVWEWCFDWYSEDYYQEAKRTNPHGPVEGQFKVLRGGAWFNLPQGLRVALRNFINPSALDETTGFRCASDVPR